MIQNFLLFCIVIMISFCGRIPNPFCTTYQTVEKIPLSLGQKFMINMDQIFSGYNLDFSIGTNTSFAQLNKRIVQLDKAEKYFPNIIAQYVEQDGNNWGRQSFILYSTLTGSIFFTFGLIKNESLIPDFSFTTIVTTDKNIKCFGAALLLDYGLAIVDCMKENQDPKNPFQNYFYYIGLASHQITRIVQNGLFVKFTTIRKRQTMKYRDNENGYEYILRVYPADGVNIEQSRNSYMQIFSVTDPYNIQIMRVIDRSLLKLQSLSIVDFKIYLGDIFFLDYWSGLYRLDILRSNHIVITGRYLKEGFYRFAVYSDDLQVGVLIALANAHAVYEIDWSDVTNPVLVNKYSIMEHSYIRDIIINDMFMVIQSTVNGTNETHTNIQIDYTWIFSRGARTYSNAYGVINHKSQQAVLQFNLAHSRLLMADQSGLSLYQIAQPILFLQQNDNTTIDTNEIITIVTVSSDPNSKILQKCQINLTLYFVKEDDLTIYKQNFGNNTKFSINYPGELHVDLDRYVMGPNITYSIKNTSSVIGEPINWINKLNNTRIVINDSIGEIIYFFSEVVTYRGEHWQIYYIQNSRYKCYIIECTNILDENQMVCKFYNQFILYTEITAFTTSYYFTKNRQLLHKYIMVVGDEVNNVRIADYFGNTMINITYEGLYQARVTDLAASNRYLYVLRGTAKIIDIYRLEECTEKCPLHFRIDSSTIRALGIKYFGPEKLTVNAAHADILFIKCRGSIIILDIGNKNKILLLDEIISAGTNNSFSRITVSEKRLIVVSDPDIVEVYSLQHIYTKNAVEYLRKLPLHGFKIQTVSDIECSDFSPLVYISAVDINRGASTILIYRTDRPGPASLFAMIPLKRLYSRPGLEIEVCGNIIDYLNIKTNQQFIIYRVFPYPQYVAKDVVHDFGFSIEFTNSKFNMSSSPMMIQTVNFPLGFNSTLQLNKTMDNLKLHHSGNYSWQDRKWFIGQILSYNFSCQECGQNESSKIHLRQHIDPLRIINFICYDFVETLQGGISVYDDLFRWRINGSIHDVINLPDQKLLERCFKLATAFHTELVVTACQVMGYGINLYLTTQTSSKPWTFGPYMTDAIFVSKLEIAGDIIMLTDINDFPEYRSRKGCVYLYSLQLDYVTGHQMDELQMIDESDLMMASGYTKNKVEIGGSHLVFAVSNDCYRLYVTDIDEGLFIMDFTHEIGRREISIITVGFINLKLLLEKNNLHMPSDALFLSVSLVASKYNPHFFMESVVITTNKYHSFEVLLIYDDNGNIISSELHRVYYRYGFFKGSGKVKTGMGYVAINYKNPHSEREAPNQTRQIVAVYDSMDYQYDHEKGYSQRYILGGVRYNKTDDLMYSFNTTYDQESNGTRIGLVLNNPYSEQLTNIWQSSISRKLALELKKDFKTQNLTLIPFSDFQKREFVIQIESAGGEKGNQSPLIIVLIVVSSLVVIGFSVYLIVLARKSQKKDTQRESLLTEEKSIRGSVLVNEKYEPPGISSISEEAKKEDKKIVEGQDKENDAQQQQQQLNKEHKDNLNDIQHDNIPQIKKQVLEQPIVEQKQANRQKKDS